jgi:hypothetical protein
MAETYSLAHLNSGGQLHLPFALTPLEMSATPNAQEAYQAPDAIKTSEEEKKLLFLPKPPPPTPGPPARSLVTKLTELSRIYGTVYVHKIE